MIIIVTILQITFGIVALLLALMSFPLFFPFRWPAAAMWAMKLVVSALSPFFALAGLLIFAVGIFTESAFISITGMYVVLIYSIHFISVTRSPKGEFEKAFGVNWKTQIKPEQMKYFLSSRTAFKLPAVPEPGFEQNIPFATIPGTDRRLLCDLWQPHISIKPSGIGFIYLHGSAFYFLDKDFKTRPLFRHMAAQGHVIMDVAYRLSPEADLMGMIQDVKRAIDWMKENSNKLNVDPGRIILGGGSAGGYLALMAGYTSGDPLFTPMELEGKDMSVAAVVAEYPATDLEALYYHTNQHVTTRTEPGVPKKKVPTKMPSWIRKKMGKDFYRLGMDRDFEKIGTMSLLMGGHPDECPERYKFFSPITHVNPTCPPTLLVHGIHDIMAPAKATRLLYKRLAREKIPVVMHFIPQTDHGFDLVWPAIAPSAHNAIYDLERFLAVVTARSNTQLKFMPGKEKNAVLKKA